MDVSGGEGRHGRGVGAPAVPNAAQVPGGENALQRPQHDDAEQHGQDQEEEEPPPVPGVVLPAEAPRGPRLRLLGLAGPDVDADAEGGGGGAVRAHAVALALAAQLLALQPHRLLLLLVAGELAEDLLAGGEGRGPLLGQGGGLATQGAGDVFADVAAVLVARRDGHEAREALKAEGVRAVQHLGRLEDVVVGVVADGALRLVHDRNLPLGPRLLGGRLHVPDLRSPLHLRGCRPLASRGLGAD